MKIIIKLLIFLLITFDFYGQNCTTNLTQTGNINSGDYKAANYITSSGVILNNQNVVYNAGKSIVLKTDFLADSNNGALLTAYIDGCEVIQDDVISWDNTPSDCDENGRKSISVSVTNNGVQEASYKIEVSKGGEFIHGGLDIDIDVGNTQQITLAGIPTGDSYDIQLKKNDDIFATQQYNFSACITAGADIVAWDYQPSDCDENGRKSISVSVTNNGAQEASYKIEVSKGGEFVHGGLDIDIDVGNTQQITLAGIPTGDSYDIQLKKNDDIFATQQYNFSACTVVVEEDEFVWDDGPSDCNDGTWTIGVSVTNRTRLSRSYKLAVYEDNSNILIGNDYTVIFNQTKRVVIDGIPSGNYEVRLERGEDILDSKLQNFRLCVAGEEDEIVWNTRASDCDDNGKRSVSVRVTNRSGQSRSYRLKVYDGNSTILTGSAISLSYSNTRLITLKDVPEGTYSVRLERNGTELERKTYYFLPCEAVSCCTGSINTAAYWRCKTYEEAGIYDWDVSKDTEYNKHNIIAAYNYYGKLYEKEPNKFYWPPLAKLVGKDFMGGFQDLHMLNRDINKIGVETFKVILEYVVADTDLPRGVKEILLNSFAAVYFGLGPDYVKNELKFIEQKFLSMQKEIFDDLAWQHLAYTTNGIGFLNNIFDNDLVYRNNYTNSEIDNLKNAWVKINLGQAFQGSTQLLKHEQWNVIQDDYEEVWDHSEFIATLLSVISWISPSPLENGSSFYNVVIENAVEIPLFPDLNDITANIANKNDRWKWVEEDLVPKFIDHLTTNSPLFIALIREEFKITDTDKSKVYLVKNNVPGLGALFNRYPSLLKFPLQGDLRNASLRCNIGLRMINDNEVGFETKNYPNPFNDYTTIEFNLNKESEVGIKVYNSLGIEVVTIADRMKFLKGKNWVNFDGSNLPPGMYNYTVYTDEKFDVQQMILLK